MLGIPKQEEAPSTPQRPLSAMGEACSRMDLTAIHQILVATHYRDDEGTNEVTDGCSSFKFTTVGWILCYNVWICTVVIPRVDPTDERYAGGKEAWRLRIPRQGF